LAGHGDFMPSTTASALTVVFTTAAALCACTGCARHAPTPSLETAESAIVASGDAPIGQSLNRVVSALRAQPAVWLPTDSPGLADTLHLKVANDNNGRPWAYMYTSEDELRSAFPDGTPFVTLTFEAALGLISQDARFGGISINHSKAKMYMLPREVFAQIATRD
jgi:hypothetical protein